jgi:hypothetical protein
VCVAGSTEGVESLRMFADIFSRVSPLLIGLEHLFFLLHVESSFARVLGPSLQKI